MDQVEEATRELVSNASFFWRLRLKSSASTSAPTPCFLGRGVEFSVGAPQVTILPQDVQPFHSQLFGIAYLCDVFPE
ncbi:hypothetical protein RRG08_044635 [Elysia crispata]|uniref:Uncharacterized protein n=1 Tax=Elysia crispata TaxID=231223 RepID=A0AAE0YML0_9GAST|nr:hypothetical protein RRG08_044635 [Elysia crispata]